MYLWHNSRPFAVVFAFESLWLGTRDIGVNSPHRLNVECPIPTLVLRHSVCPPQLYATIFRLSDYSQWFETPHLEAVLDSSICVALTYPAISHLGAARALAFHPDELCLATGGDDCTVKRSGILPSNYGSRTSAYLCGHSAAITRQIHAPLKGLLYSASLLDSLICVWALPLQSHTTYAPDDETRVREELIGHADAVWKLALVRDESTLTSCGVEGTVIVWDMSGPSGGGSLRLTWGWADLENADDFHADYDVSGATAVETLKADLKKVTVTYQNAVVKVFDIESGKELSRLQSDMSYDGIPATQINCIVSHPLGELACFIAGHTINILRIFRADV